MTEAVPAPDVLLHEEEGEAMLLHVGSGRYFGLNRSGVVVWKALVTGADPAAALHAQWPNLDLAACQADAAALIAALLQAGLAHGADPTAER